MSEQIKELFSSVSTSPFLAFMLIIFLVQAYIIVDKLDNINTVLIEIEKSNARTQQILQDRLAKEH